jgi:iron complex transport system substrate-binding protein
MLRLIIFIALFCFFLTSTADARMITDMAGRKVTIPDRIEKSVGLSPPITYLLYTIEPTIVVGLNFPLLENEKIYTVEQFKKLPVIGGMVGEGRNLNLEVLLKIKPDVAFLWERSGGETSAINKEYERTLKTLGIPVVYVRFDALGDYPAAIRFVGDVINKKERAAKLERYATDTIQKVAHAVASMPVGKKISVYYAEGLDGLSSDGEGSMHTELIPLSGGKNVFRMKNPSAMGMEKISMEQLVMYDPEVILVKEKKCYELILKDTRWKQLRAVHNKKVYLIPYVPFNWFDRPPSYMRLLGMQWLANLLHPGLYKVDMLKESKAFYSLFMFRELSDQEVRNVLWP